MKITEYPKTETLADNNVFLVDGEQGTQGILAVHAIAALMGIFGANNLSDVLNLNALEQAASGTLKASDKLMVGNGNGNVAAALPDVFYDMVDMIADGSVQEYSLSLRRAIWRGKNLGSEVTADQYAAIADGSFKGLFLGDGWKINNVFWRIVDFDYWWGTGDTACYTHHLVIMPDECLYSSKMNETNSTTGGYRGVKDRFVLNDAAAAASNCFTSAKMLNHREYFTNAVTDGYPSAGAWYYSAIDLPNEIMIYGTKVFTPASTGAVVPNLYTIDKTQLAAMRVNPTLIMPNREWYWLRDVVSAADFAYVDGRGDADFTGASLVGGVRPVFGIVG